ncbi:hypothetical protein FDP41_000947 [Naegleria fowleri]|uniref:Uncharacterized protein n=1 Tax=Naegleria fowleri TaxID=5763 RepID=A0A6A5BZN8_NAEFO|nr:uncharacterized protein FDP41_000947 [Naegleria fowleri]KAF0979794.1 hypothetical protein FDP41_000947 [Naegleria fowleri]
MDHNLPQSYLDLTSELLQEIFNIYIDENRLYTYSFVRIQGFENGIGQNNNVLSTTSTTTVSYQVAISKPTKEKPIPSIVYNIRVDFKIPSHKILKQLSSLPFIQHVQFLVEHRKEPFELCLLIEEGVLTDSKEAIKKEFDLISLIDQFMGKELTLQKSSLK